VKDRPISPEDFAATALHALGVPPETRLAADGSTRPASSRLLIYSDELVIGDVAKAAFEQGDVVDDIRLAIPHEIVSDGMSLSVSAMSANAHRPSPSRQSSSYDRPVS
jgi:hypothetical protein